MTRILLRAPKDPFEVRSPEQVLERNLIGDNSGNLVFIDAAHKLLSVPGARIAPDRFELGSRRADRINDEFDVYAIPLANAFRPTFRPQLERMTELIRRLRIPVVVLGVGAQATVDYDWTRLKPMEASVKAFVAAVLDHGPTIGVRGELTADYLRSLGFGDVDVIGCPSMFTWGPDLPMTRPTTGPLTRDARVVLTVSPYLKGVGSLATHHAEAYPNLVYIAQDIITLELLLWGRYRAGSNETPDHPVHLDHPLLRDNRTMLFTDPWPWIDDLRTRDFAFGTRIHGAITALLAGTPAFVLAHDSRTLELARYFAIPHRRLRDITPTTDAAELYAEADFAALHAGHPDRWAAFTAYLARHRVDHVFRHEGAAAAWDARVAATPWLPAVTPALDRGLARGTVVRVRRARYDALRAARRSQLKRAPARVVRRLFR